ncbi:hypothetical protein HID58_055034 [Brassica napus]|uniref:Secreted protein n=1 Tax=Brassica napus TaxID=3708 RepID=A0ABQ8AJA5_BRANA|nr:hypothetical protein HID58_055034 [Brassica napus]
MTSVWPPAPGPVTRVWPPAPRAVTSGWPPAPRAVSSTWPPALGAVACVWPPGVRGCVPRVTRFDCSFLGFSFQRLFCGKSVDKK